VGDERLIWGSPKRGCVKEGCGGRRGALAFERTDRQGGEGRRQIVNICGQVEMNEDTLFHSY